MIARLINQDIIDSQFFRNGEDMAFETKVSIDRVTVVGEVTIDEIIGVVSSSKHWKQSSEMEFNLVRELENGSAENIAYLGKSKYKNSFRLDTSVHFDLDGFFYEEVTSILSLFVNPRFSRLDIAFDIFNIEELGMRSMSHRLYRSNVGEKVFSEEIKGRGKDVETIYYGSPRSLEQVRYYNKLVEMKKNKKEVPEGVKSWERLELQLRGKKTHEWFESASKMLIDFKLAKLNNVENVQHRAILFALENGIMQYSELSSATAASYRKMQALNQGYNTTLSNILTKTLLDNMKKIEHDLYSFISRYNILVDEEFRKNVERIQKNKRNN